MGGSAYAESAYGRENSVHELIMVGGNTQVQSIATEGKSEFQCNQRHDDSAKMETFHSNSI